MAEKENMTDNVEAPAVICDNSIFNANVTPKSSHSVEGNLSGRPIAALFRPWPPLFGANTDSENRGRPCVNGFRPDFLRFSRNFSQYSRYFRCIRPLPAEIVQIGTFPS